LRIECGCRCINCRSINLDSRQTGEIEPDGYFDMHHTCKDCNEHFDHLDGTTFEKCEECSFNSNSN